VTPNIARIDTSRGSGRAPLRIGSFSNAVLAIGSYILHFEATGYVDTTTTTVISETQPASVMMNMCRVPVSPAIVFSDTSFHKCVWSDHLADSVRTINPAGNFYLFVKIRLTGGLWSQVEENATIQWNCGKYLYQAAIFDDMSLSSLDHDVWIALGPSSWPVGEDQLWRLTRLGTAGTNSVHWLGIEGSSQAPNPTGGEMMIFAKVTKTFAR
ncbi:MAG: hypothetical protein ABIJ91_04240, partial [Candidatus Kuenenbacteria bacterium]